MRNEVKIMAVILVVVIVGAFVGAQYYRGKVENAPKPSTPNSSLVREDSPSMGPAEAKVTIVEFLDPECEACAAFAPRVKGVMKDYDGRVRLVVRYLPLHPNSARAVTFIEAAGQQDKLWQAMDLLFQKQPEWGERHGAPAGYVKPDVPALFEGYAKELGLDLDKFDADSKDPRITAKMDRDRKDAQNVNARQTPTLFVNGRKLSGLSESELRSMIEEELKK
ncbi:MAG: DsbA family protein [Pyrinomonadaceae bacterium]